MKRRLLGICGVLLFGSFGMLSGVASAHDEAQASDGVQRLEMSDEEKERRREECVRMYDFCMEACDKRYPKPNQGAERGRCHQECSDKNTECLKKIPSNPIPDPDY
jgi:hypothetical protein